MTVTPLVPTRAVSHQPQIIVCGLGRTGLRIFALLRQQGAFNMPTPWC